MTSHKVLALMFQLRAENSRTGTLIAWLDQMGQGRHLKHSHPSPTLLDAKAGDRLVCNGEHVLAVVRVKPWRATDRRDETQYDWVTSGAAWEQTQ